MTTQPLAPPTHDVTAISWDDVTLFANEIGTLLDELKKIAPTLNNQSVFAVMPGTFALADQLRTSTADLGTSLKTAATWMERLLGDVHDGLTNAVQTFSKVDSLQKESGQNLLGQLQNVNTDLGGGPTAGPAK